MVGNSHVALGVQGFGAVVCCCSGVLDAVEGINYALGRWGYWQLKGLGYGGYGRGIRFMHGLIQGTASDMFALSCRSFVLKKS